MAPALSTKPPASIETVSRGLALPRLYGVCIKHCDALHQNKLDAINFPCRAPC
jgi:hypothetical protein